MSIEDQYIDFVNGLNDGLNASLNIIAGALVNPLLSAAQKLELLEPISKLLSR